MKNILCLAIGLLFLLTGCNKSSYQKAVAGTTWEEKPLVGKFAGSYYWIRFHQGNTFDMKLHLFTDVVDTGTVPCSNNRTDYIKGTYAINGTQITFDGRYCDEAFNNTQANCQGKVGYQASYSMTFIGNDMVFDAEKNDYQKIWLVKKY